MLSPVKPDRSIQSLNVEITSVKDKFEDPLGYLIIGAEAEPSGSMYRKFKLSQREADVASGLLNGLRTQAIAESLGISERTVKAHISNIFKKTGVSSRVEFISMFFEEKRQ